MMEKHMFRLIATVGLLLLGTTYAYAYADDLDYMSDQSLQRYATSQVPAAIGLIRFAQSEMARGAKAHSAAATKRYVDLLATYHNRGLSECTNIELTVRNRNKQKLPKWYAETLKRAGARSCVEVR